MAEENKKLHKCDEISILSETNSDFSLKAERKNKLSELTKMNVKKRKKNLNKQVSENKKRPKKLKETSRDRLLKLNNSYANNHFGIWIQCNKCSKWRKVMEYEEEHEVPKYWCCSMSLLGAKSCDEPENICEDFSPVDLIPGSIVWAKYDGYPWWPAMIEDDPNIEEYYWIEKNGKVSYNVTFLDDKVSRAWIPALCVRSFLDPPKHKYLNARFSKYSSLLAAAEMKAKNAMNMSIQERLKNFSFAHQYKGKWGSPLPSGDEGEENEKDLTQMLLEEVNDIESIKSTDSDYRSVSSLELKKNEVDNEPGHEISIKDIIEEMVNEPLVNEPYHEISSKDNSEYKKKQANKKKIIKAQSKKVSKLSNEYNNTHPKEENETEKNTEIFTLPKGKEDKCTHIKLEGYHKTEEKIPQNKKSTTFSLQKAIKASKPSSKNKANKVMKTSKVKNNLLANSEEKMDSIKENKTETKSSTMKKLLEDVEVVNVLQKKNLSENPLENSRYKKKITFHPPTKNKNICEDNDSKSIDEKKIASNVILHNTNSVIEEMPEKELEVKIQSNKTATVAKKGLKNADNRNGKESIKTENNLKTDIVQTLEKNLKNSLESVSMQENETLTKDDSCNLKGILSPENKRNQKQDKKIYKKGLKNDLANKSITKMQQINVMEVDSSTEDLLESGTRNSEITETLKFTKQNISKREKDKKNLKIDYIKTETKQKQEKCFADDDVIKEILSDADSNQEKFSLSIERNLQEIEDENSDPFEAE